MTHTETSAVARQAMVIGLVGLAILAIAVIVWKAIHILLLAFLAILFAILVQGAAGQVQRWIGTPYWVSVTVVLIACGACIAIAAYFRAPAISQQFSELQGQLPKAMDGLRTMMQQHAITREILERTPSLRHILDGSAFANLSAAISGLVGAIGYALFVLFTFFFVVYEPHLYRRGIEALVSPEHRPTARHVLNDLWTTLLWWLTARIAAMLLVGALVGVGLWILGIPFALSLGLLAALLDFVPNFGPIIAGVPAVLLAVAQNPEKALYVALLYWGVQIIEGYVITPIAQKRAINMPPALVVGSQFILGAVLGVLGFVAATPLVASALVVIQDLYIEPRDARRGSQ